MGYKANFTGEIAITPPLTWARIRQPFGDRILQDLRIRQDEDVRDSDEGQVKVITGVAVEPTSSYGSGYGMVDDLQALVDVHGSGHQFTGHIEATSEEGDKWRLAVRDGQAVQVHPRIVWPDEED
jgi:Family of unknown function (DUF6205)